ncbi:3-isopropylmalate dehydratase large subunit [Ramlibacter sp. G-1-2-2]|uniref:3-isopropylmalate dehydratase large subunit n=1 Tax=Ramlibacter agri TaxID=2728837 RepID=A0A848H5Q4_9BURK|nr:3-isopropylmalate dehydratase large subunit [Ramlibacter agri]NML44849.1 3-isopropylmalate dehydratase large subunit [Ramlibacter agri]
MGMTITEKILARAAGLAAVQPGQFLDCKVDQVASMDLQGKLVFNTLGKLGSEQLFDPARVALTLDHQSPAQTVAIADVHAAIRVAAKKFEVKNLFDVGSGIMHVVMPERGLVLPGELVIMNESHTPTGGAMGAVVIGVGQTDAAVAAALGEIWLVVPATIRVNLRGALRDGVTTKDVALHLMKLLGYERKAIYKTIEIGGPGVAALSMDARFTITNYCSDMGAKSAIFEPDAVTLAYANARKQREFTPVSSDADAKYEEVIEVDLAALEPLLACPHALDNIHSVASQAGKAINEAFIGTCTNGRFEDLEAAARIVAGRQVAPGVRFVVVPASREVYQRALAAGHVATLAEAGALIFPPGCGPCMGEHSGVLGAGEVAISSGNRNMKGRMGSPDSFVYLGSPQTVAASAVQGVITDPRTLEPVEAAHA